VVKVGRGWVAGEAAGLVEGVGMEELLQASGLRGSIKSLSNTCISEAVGR
jgi:hypothetical protein